MTNESLKDHERKDPRSQRSSKAPSYEPVKIGKGQSKVVRVGHEEIVALAICPMIQHAGPAVSGPRRWSQGSPL